jgi:hypothetical protein
MVNDWYIDTDNTMFRQQKKGARTDNTSEEAVTKQASHNNVTITSYASLVIAQHNTK